MIASPPTTGYLTREYLVDLTSPNPESPRNYLRARVMSNVNTSGTEKREAYRGQTVIPGPGMNRRARRMRASLSRKKKP